MTRPAPQASSLERLFDPRGVAVIGEVKGEAQQLPGILGQQIDIAVAVMARAKARPDCRAGGG